MKCSKHLGSVVVVAGIVLPLLANIAIAAQWFPKGPLPRNGHSAVLDTGEDRMIVFGGLTFSVDAPPAAHFNDVWYFTSADSIGAADSTWLRAQPLGAPPPARAGHSAVLSESTNRMIVFGGAGGFAAPCFNDTWLLANANGVNANPVWAKLNPAGPPSARFSHRAVYNPTSNRMIMFGGSACFGGVTFDDVWVLSHASAVGGSPMWTQLAPSGGPPPTRAGFGEVYDSANNRMIIFGGSNSKGFLNDTWVLVGADGSAGTPVWTQLSPSGGPPSAREVPSATLDPIKNRMTVFGGFDTHPLNDLWVLTNANGLGGASAWINITATGTLPHARFSHTAVYDQGTNRMTIFGGEITADGNSTDTVSVLDRANGL